jgi:hypothetical protein
MDYARLETDTLKDVTDDYRTARPMQNASLLL